MTQSPTLGSTLRFIVRHPANRRRKVRALLTFAGWQIWKRTIRRPITAKLSNGSRVRVYPDSKSGSLALYTQLPEYDDMQFATRLLKPGDMVIDVGANIGLYSLLVASRVREGRVLAFEPHPVAAARLRENIEINRLRNIEVRVEALGATAGQALLTTNLDTANYIVVDDADGPTLGVPVSALDDVIVAGSKVALIKLDTEGFESAVLAGASRLLRDGSVLSWIVEVREHGRRYGRGDETVLQTFRRSGYEPYRYSAERGMLESADHPDMETGWNLILIKDLDEVNRRLRSTRQ